MTADQIAQARHFDDFAAQHVAPLAGEMDRSGRFSADLIPELAARCYLGALIPNDYGGAQWDYATFGALNAALGRACSSTRSLITVHSMVGYAINRWGRAAQKERWLPQLANGSTIAAFALSEPNAGSDVNAITTSAEKTDGGYRLNGQKAWTTFGALADLFLVFAQQDGQPVALLVEREGVDVRPIPNMLGIRGSMTADLHFNDLFVPADHLLAGRGFGIAAVALTALDVGRYSVAWGCVGVAEAALTASVAHADQRMTFGKPLRDRQLIQRHITDMATHSKAARRLALHAGQLWDANDKTASAETLVAKYFASQTAFNAANRAVQIHGASGCRDDSTPARLLRDAKIMEIIEGSHEMQQQMIAQTVFAAHEKALTPQPPLPKARGGENDSGNLLPLSLRERGQG